MNDWCLRATQGNRMRTLTGTIIALVALVACDASKQTPLGAPEPVAAVELGNAAELDPLTSAQQFVANADGGDIIIERQVHEDLGINQIRAHLLLLARSFARGDFAVRGFIHEKPIPGTNVMSDRADKIEYTVEDLPHGGVVHIRTTDPQALQAIHSFISFELAEKKPEN